MLISVEFMREWIRSRTRSELGASLVEYALLLAFIAIVCVAAVTTLGGKVSSSFTSTNSTL